MLSSEDSQCKFPYETTLIPLFRHRGAEIPESRTKRGPDRLSPIRAINLAITYSRKALRLTTIGGTELNGRVREGNGWDLCPIVTRKVTRQPRSSRMPQENFVSVNQTPRPHRGHGKPHE